MLIDRSFDHRRQSDTLTEVHDLDGHLVQVTVHRDTYPQQSHAHARLLNAHHEWTPLVDAPASDWHTGTRPVAADPRDQRERALLQVAGPLLQRARAVVDRIHPPSSPPQHASAGDQPPARRRRTS